MRKLLVILFLSSFAANAQEVNLDSLYASWQDKSIPDTSRFNAFNEFIRKKYLFSRPDTAFQLITEAIEFAVQTNNRYGEANGLSTAGIAQAVMGNAKESIEYFQKSLSIFEELNIRGGIKKGMINLANMYVTIGNIDEGLRIFQQLLKISEVDNDIEIQASTYNSMARLYNRTGNFNESRICAEKALAFAILIDDTKEMASAWNSIGISSSAQGNILEGREALLKSEPLYRSANDGRGLSSALMNIGISYYQEGNFQKAIEYYKRSSEIAESIGNIGSVSNLKQNMGLLLIDLNDFKEGRKYLLECIDLYSQMGDKRGQADALGNLAATYNMEGNFSEALKIDQQMYELRLEIRDSVGIAKALSNIGIDYRGLHEHEKALQYYSESLSTFIKSGYRYGTANLYNNLSNLLYEMGDIEGSVNNSSEGLKISRDIRSKELELHALRSLYYSMCTLDSLDRAADYISTLVSIQKKLVKHNFVLLTEDQKENYFLTLSPDLGFYYDFTISKDKAPTDMLDGSYDNALGTKGLLLKSSTALRGVILGSGDSTLIQQYHEWLNFKKDIVDLMAQGEDIDSLMDIANQLEKELAGKSQEFADIKKVQELTWKDVQLDLKEGETAIEFIRFTHQEDYRNDSNKVQLYAALIINKNSEHPKMVRLFEEPELEKIIGTFPGNNLSYIEQVYGTKENTKSQLYDLIWKPMEKELAGAKKVYVSPVGLLHKISFAALAKEQDVFLCDNYEIEMMSSTGKIVLSADDNASVTEAELSEGTRSDEATTASTTLFGGIQYNSDSTTTQVWNYLDGSLSETQQIEKILKKNKVSYNYFNQNNATEAQFKEIASNSNILHIATHGFFYPDPDIAQKDFIDKEESEEPINFRGGRQGVGVSTFVKSRNPLMRSGLAFAGANDVWNRTNIDGEDGVLTAAEVATIDMRNTELVVLSACETGLGDIKGSEGVYGLQRSFKMAGVKYLIMSLWQVPDKETAEFMTTFYQHLTKTNDIKQSFNQTQAQMRKKYDPYYWAAFVLVE